MTGKAVRPDLTSRTTIAMIFGAGVAMRSRSPAGSDLTSGSATEIAYCTFHMTLTWLVEVDSTYTVIHLLVVDVSCVLF